MSDPIQKVKAIDSHTGGEPTRVVIEGGPVLLGDTVAEKREYFRTHHDAYRAAMVEEPRGSDVLVGAMLVEPSDPSCSIGVIFFNNAGMLGMCGHGTIGLVATLAYLGRIAPGKHRIETPVGVVTAELYENGEVSVQNVPSYRWKKAVPVEVPEYGTFTGDVAWGGNWFFLVENHGQELILENVETLATVTWEIRQALNRNGITGKAGQEIDHIELFGPPTHPDAHSRNFVLCPGKAYDRSPCGTGTSAKLACLFADGKLREGETWVQESILGSVFSGSVQQNGENVIPTIRGSAFVTAEATLLLNLDDPFCWGIG